MTSFRIENKIRILTFVKFEKRFGIVRLRNDVRNLIGRKFFEI